MQSTIDATSKRRSRPRALVAAAVMFLGVAGAMTSVSAFIISTSDVVTRPFSHVSVARTQHLPKTLFGSITNDDAGDDEKKLTIETVTDDNMETLLKPSSNHPVLVDAFAPWCVMSSVSILCRSCMYANVLTTSLAIVLLFQPISTGVVPASYLTRSYAKHSHVTLIKLTSCDGMSTTRKILQS